MPVTVDYYAVLSRAVEASKADPGQLRSAIYNMARVNLRREILWQNPAISEAELNTHLLALEDAIGRVEARQSQNHSENRSESYDNLVFRPDDPRHLIEALNVEPHAEPPAVEVQIEHPQEQAHEQAHEQTQEQAYAEPEPPIEAVTVFELPPEPEPQPEPELYVEPALARPVDLDAHYEPVNEQEPPAESRGELVILEPEPPMAMQSGPMLRAAPNIIVDYHPPPQEIAYAPEPAPRRIRNGIGSFVQLTAAALLAVAIFAVMTGQLNIRWLGNKQQQAAAVPPAVQAAPPAPVAAAPVVAVPAPPPFPLPATYGVYVVNNDKLIELERFAIRVPDPRVLISPEIREPSRVALPDGKVAFVVFRRELANGAPEKVPVRVVAKVAREMTFTDGKATTSNVENLWRIRNNAFELRVSPLNDNRDLIVIKPEADFVFPAGRYALVINGQGYDFSVAGPITSPLQCLERIETMNGAMYSECRNTKVN